MSSIDNKKALDEIFELGNMELSKQLKVPYHTVGSWRFKHQRNDLSIEKQIEIISRMNYQMENTISWKKLQK
jgi:hypothetical protein